jgi:hypothetical protein
MLRGLATRAASVARGLGLGRGWSGGRLISARAVLARGFPPLAAGSVLMASQFSVLQLPLPFSLASPSFPFDPAVDADR